MSGEYLMSVAGERYFEVTDTAVTLNYKNIEIFFEGEDPSKVLRDSLNIALKGHFHTLMDYVSSKFEWNANIIQNIVYKIYLRCPARMY